MKPAWRYLASGLALMALVAFGLRWMLRQPTPDAGAGDRLQRVAVVASDVRDNAMQQLQLRAAALATDPAFASYVVQAMEPGAAPNGGIDRASIADLLKSRRSGYDLAMVLDGKGRPVAADGPRLGEAAEWPRDPLVKRTLATLRPSAGAWVHGGRLYWVAVNPLVRGGIAQGALLTAAKINDDYAATISRHTGAAIVLLVAGEDGYVIASAHALPSWARTSLPELAAGLPATRTAPLQDTTLKLPPGHADEMARVVPVPTTSSQALVVAIAEAPEAPSSGWWPALGIFVLGALAVLWHWWRVERPLEQLAERLGAVARGRRPPEFAMHGSVNVRRVARRLNRLFSSDKVRRFQDPAR